MNGYAVVDWRVPGMAAFVHLNCRRDGGRVPHQAVRSEQGDAFRLCLSWRHRNSRAVDGDECTRELARLWIPANSEVKHASRIAYCRRSVPSARRDLNCLCSGSGLLPNSRLYDDSRPGWSTGLSFRVHDGRCLLHRQSHLARQKGAGRSGGGCVGREITPGTIKETRFLHRSFRAQRPGFFCGGPVHCTLVQKAQRNK